MEPYIFGIVILHNMENGRRKKINKYAMEFFMTSIDKEDLIRYNIRVKV